jgi:hypothetical protein
LIATRLAVFVALAVALAGQSKPKDVTGWDNIKWGMTIAEARSAYRVDTQPETKGDWTLLTLKPVKIGSVEMGVQVGARRGSDKITSVTLWSHFGLPSSSPSSGPHDFETLKASLIQQYGLPAKEEAKRGLNFRSIKTLVWTFPSTSIQMTMEQSASLPGLGNIDLDYSANEK